MRPVATDVAHAAWSVRLCVCVFSTRVSCAKTVVPIEMPIGGWLIWVQGTTYKMWVQIPHRKWNFWGDMCRPMAKYLPHVNVPAQFTRRTNAFATARGDMTAMRPFAKLLWTLVLVDTKKLMFLQFHITHKEGRRYLISCLVMTWLCNIICAACATIGSIFMLATAITLSCLSTHYIHPATGLFIIFISPKLVERKKTIK